MLMMPNLRCKNFTLFRIQCIQNKNNYTKRNDAESVENYGKIPNTSTWLFRFLLMKLFKPFKTTNGIYINNSKHNDTE